MPDDTALAEARIAPAALPDERALRHFAFERNDAAAYDHWRALPADAQRRALLDRYIFLAVLSHAASKLDSLESISRTRLLSHASRTQALLVEVAATMRVERIPFGVEWFQGLECWSAALLAHRLFALTEQTLQLAHDSGSSRFAGTHQALRATEALLLATTGRPEDAAQIAARYALRPYLLPDRRLRPQIYRRLMAALVLVGRIREYRSLLWRGLTDVYFDRATRSWFVQQARITYGSVLRTLVRAEVRATLRLQFALAEAAELLGRLRVMRWLRVDRALNWANLALAYYLKYGRAQRQLVAPPRQSSAADRILVTRAMGGLGDLLMMTPGLRALRRAHPDTPIHMAIPRGYFTLFEGNTDIECVDIDSPELDAGSYRLWYDLTDCPASRVESRQAPKVRSDRVSIFASAIGIGRGALARSGYTPRYEVAPMEAGFAQSFIARLNPERRPVIGIQLHSAESYRDYPHNAALAAELARDFCVLLFDSQAIEGFVEAGLHKVVLPLRQSFAVAAQCDVLIAPDSSFVHLGAALGKRVLAIYGPISGKVRCRRFPTVQVLAPSPDEFPCAPCWRSEYTPCGLTGQRESACLRSIEPCAVAALARRLAGATA